MSRKHFLDQWTFTPPKPPKIGPLDVVLGCLLPNILVYGVFMGSAWLGIRTGTPPVVWLIIISVALYFVIVPEKTRRDRLKVSSVGDAPKPSHDKKKGDLDVTSDNEMSYRIRGGGGKSGGNTLLDLAGVYILRYWLPPNAQLSIHFYNLYNQNARCLVHDVTGVDMITAEIERGRYEISVWLKTTEGKIGDWLIELEPVYDSALDGTESDSERLIAES